MVYRRSSIILLSLLGGLPPKGSICLMMGESTLPLTVELIFPLTAAFATVELESTVVVIRLGSTPPLCEVLSR